MKFFLVAVFLTAIFGKIQSQPVGDDGDLVEKIREIINKIVDVVPDPIAIKDVDIKIPENSVLNGELDISEISISGLKSLTIDTLTLDAGTNQLNFQVNIGDIITVIESRLVLSGLLAVDHSLSVHVDLKNLKTIGYAVIAEDKKSVEDLSVLISLAESDFDIKGLLDNDELSEEVSKLLTDNVATILNKLNSDLSPAISKVIKDIINLILKIEG